MKKNLILCFSSLRPSQYNSSMLEQREKNYDLALEWLLKSIPNNWDIIYNDNTLSSLNDLKNESLKKRLQNERIKLIFHKSNEGSKNKGAGEHDMCKNSFLEINPNDYEWISYFTARHIIPNSWYFDKIEKDLSNYECVMSNPKFYYLNNFISVSCASGSYNDMLFSMKSNIFNEFIAHIDVELLKAQHKNSENHLYEFVAGNGLKTFELESLGILRNDHQSHGWHII